MKRIIVPLLIVFVAGAIAFLYVHRHREPKPENVVVLFIGKNAASDNQTSGVSKEFVENLAEYIRKRQALGQRVLIGIPVGDSKNAEDVVYVEGGKLTTLESSVGNNPENDTKYYRDGEHEFIVAEGDSISGSGPPETDEEYRTRLKKLQDRPLRAK